MALTEANPPWNFLDGGDHPVGYDADVANELARRLRIGRVDFVGSDFASFVGGIRADRFDIVISGQTITARRRTQVDFSRPYAVNEVSIFIRQDNDAIAGVKDLAGKKIAVSEGTTQADFARTGIPEADVRTYKNATLGLTDLAQGRADAALISRFQGVYLAQNKGLPVKPVGPTLQREVLGMSFRKGSLPFKQAVDQAINAMIADGTLSTFSRRWLNGIDMAAELREVQASQYS
ncbi:cystine transporter subunit [Planotetraspora thailandica]|uniref:Cystine transporter subunit n=1 Tax=Planotetraspora thailandica TaxID=487172 RepID=A0A8J3V2N7_9ACTN|nr:cystine transporter subunit [Planotetraspora thailandica]